MNTRFARIGHLAQHEGPSPFKGEDRRGMGLARNNPIPTPALPLKGRERGAARLSRIAKALALAGLAAAAAPALAVDYSLKAGVVSVRMPGPNGTDVPVPMWGFGLDGASCVPVPPATTCPLTVPGPMLTVPPGDTTLNITVRNFLPQPISIVIPGQNAVMTPVWLDADGVTTYSGSRPPGNITARVRSFTHETPPNGTATYNWTGMKPGSFLYHSGTHPQVQVQMGLYGAVKHDAAAGQAYAGVAYDNEIVLLFSEVDRLMHQAINSGKYGDAALGGPTSTLNYKPRFFLINGQPYRHAIPATPTTPAVPGTPAIQVPATGTTLVRLINAGLRTHVPVFDGGYWSVVAEDGEPYAFPREQYSAFLPAAKTTDVLLPALGPGRYTLQDRRLDVTNAGDPNGGMFAVLKVAGGGAPPTFTSVPPATGTQGQLYEYVMSATASKGGAVSYGLISGPAGMSVVNGDTVRWTPTATQVGLQAATVRATDSANQSTAQAFSITVANVNDPPVANVDAYSMMMDSQFNLAAPGILGNDTDIDGDVLVAGNYTALNPPGALIFRRGTDGSLSFKPPAGFLGTKSFTYRAKDPTGANSQPATVSISVFANRAPVAVNDAPYAPRRRLQTYTPVIIPVLANDSDPDQAIDPTYGIQPGSVTIIGAPSQGGTATVNGDGTVAYTPVLNFIGTETFSYTISDQKGLLSNTATVSITVN